jgi:predicted nicotinamide N-methyase
MSAVLVTSDVHALFTCNVDGEGDGTHVLSRVRLGTSSSSSTTTSSSSSEDVVGADNDDVVSPKRRRRDVSQISHTINIYHKQNSTLDDVGEQLWGAALLLADYAISRRDDDIVRRSLIVELGSGVGFLSVVFSMLGLSFYATDYKDNMLHLIQRNLQANVHLRGSMMATTAVSGDAGRGEVRRLDWTKQNNPRTDTDAGPDEGESAFPWCASDRARLNSSSCLYVAADVVYHDSLTDAFFAQVDALLRHGEQLWLALEKRLNFSLAELAVVAHGYRNFLAWIQQPCPPGAVAAQTGGAAAPSAGGPATHPSASAPVRRTPSGRVFRGVLVDLDRVPQTVLGYTRERMEIWIITVDA